jgi:hypothetical protein
MATGVQQGRAWPHCWCSKRSASSWELGAEQVLSRSRKAPSLSSCWQVASTTSPCGLPLARTQALRPASRRIHSADSHLQGTLAATANQPTAGESAAGSLAQLLLPGSGKQLVGSCTPRWVGHQRGLAGARQAGFRWFLHLSLGGVVRAVWPSHVWPPHTKKRRRPGCGASHQAGSLAPEVCRHVVSPTDLLGVTSLLTLLCMCAADSAIS